MPTIGLGLLAALKEAFASAVDLVPQELRRDFILVGGTSLLYLGSDRATRDVDIAVRPAALHAFDEAASKDPRFHKTPMQTWEYKATNDINIEFEFLEQGGEFFRLITAAREIVLGGGMRAGVGELAVSKARTYLCRGEDKDLEDFQFLIRKMRELGESFADVVFYEGDEGEMNDKEALKSVAEESGRAYVDLLQNLLEL
ncbi:MAG: hypothetical protein M1829_003014 [Trizodia sp. TS-e1964]|nr:MAG: hypothetical protein M1829_003014 [Trizodia sp. TS-e1964]